MRSITTLLPLVLVALSNCADRSPSVDERAMALAEDVAVGDGEIVMTPAVGEPGGSIPERQIGAEHAVRGDDAIPDVEAVVDVDGDGVPERNDCNDLDPTVSPLLPDIRCNDADENCNGVDDCDRDGDGWRDVDDQDPDLPAAEPPGPQDPPRWP